MNKVKPIDEILAHNLVLDYPNILVCEVEEVRNLEALANELITALEFIYKECDWEEFAQGDIRIGSVINKALSGVKEYKNEVEEQKQELSVFAKMVITYDKQIESMKCCCNCVYEDKEGFQEPCNNCSVGLRPDGNDNWKQKE